MKTPSVALKERVKLHAGEAIRVVPLHQPKPVISIDELAEAKRGGDADSELFDGKPHASPKSAHLVYNGGPLITNVQVFNIYWGVKWNTTAASKKMMANLDQFFTTILTSSLMTQLGEYNVPGQKIGPGKFIGSTAITANAPVNSVTDSAAQKELKKWIKAKTVPATTKNTLYFIYLDPHITSIMGGSRSCQSYCGYHSNTGAVYYAVMPYPTCSGCLGGMNAFDALTATSSHELCEAITDPVPGSGWYDQNNGEIGDICAWNFKKVAGYSVQLEWSNKHNKCV